MTKLPAIHPLMADVANMPNRSIETANPSIPIAATGRRPQLLLLRPQNALMKDQSAADSEKIAPAIQSGRSSSRDSGGRIAPVSIVLPAPTATRQKKRSRNAPRRSALESLLSFSGASDMTRIRTVDAKYQANISPCCLPLRDSKQRQRCDYAIDNEAI